MSQRKLNSREFKLEAVRLLAQSDKPIVELARELGIRRNLLYSWRCRVPSARERANQALVQQLREQHLNTRRAYGAVKMWRHLLQLGIPCGKHRVARLRRLNGLESQRQKARRASVAARNGHPHAPCLIEAPFQAPPPATGADPPHRPGQALCQ